MDFIDDKELRAKANNALEYVAWLVLSQRENPNENFKEETYRVTVLYIVSILEAVLFYLYKNRSEKIEKEVFKEVTLLKSIFQNKENRGVVVIAIKDLEEQEKKIGMQDLVQHFVKHKIMKSETAKSILSINNIRNTHHLTKNRSKKCTEEDVEKALDLLDYTLNKVPLYLSKAK